MDLKNNNNYPFLSKHLHNLLLNSNESLKILFEIEKKLFLKKNINNQITSLFITGLARSGSTILLNSLYNTKFFASLKYRDMPFITSPNLWSKINLKKKKGNFQSRAHNDGIKIDYDSPEAFEEIFWRSQLNLNSKNALALDQNLYTNKIIYNFKKYIQLVCLKEKRNFYLSKNNSNILRVQTLLNNISRKKILILFRLPNEQCLSLWEQHLNFKKLQEKNKYILNYMNLLSHYEFGLNHQPIMLRDFKSNFITDDINYWFEYWLMIYSNLIEIAKINNKDIIFLSYEKLVASPEKVICRILKMLNIDIKEHKTTIYKKEKKPSNFEVKKNILEKTQSIYERMKKYEIEL